MSVLPILFLAMVSLDGAYSLKCYTCKGVKECESPSEVTCSDNQVYCIALNVRQDNAEDFIYMDCANESIGNNICQDLENDQCYTCQEDSCNENLPE
ncbi:lymphocyte antigen 6G [Tribolium madens]|uniref:lymphocyte antigen 6G n=1 Tax=Tribolium madens TaxID=41895 RepID=UPI001CF75601|nr:lymphocyte antigen 6G [Tribolium madens]